MADDEASKLVRMEFRITRLERERLNEMAKKLGMKPTRLLYSFFLQHIEADESYTPAFKLAKKPDRAVRFYMDDEEVDALTKETQRLKTTKTLWLRKIVRDALSMPDLGG